MLLDDEDEGATPSLRGMRSRFARELEVSLMAVAIKHVILL
jgi:hypothetical protein